MSKEAIEQTLDNDKWLAENGEAVKNLFPELWTHIGNINVLGLMFQFKILGVDWRSEEEFAFALAVCERRKLVRREGYTLRRYS